MSTPAQFPPAVALIVCFKLACPFARLRIYNRFQRRGQHSIQPNYAFTPVHGPTEKSLFRDSYRIVGRYHFYQRKDISYDYVIVYDRDSQSYWCKRFNLQSTLPWEIIELSKYDDNKEECAEFKIMKLSQLNTFEFAIIKNDTLSHPTPFNVSDIELRPKGLYWDIKTTDVPINYLRNSSRTNTPYIEHYQYPFRDHNYVEIHCEECGQMMIFDHNYGITSSVYCSDICKTKNHNFHGSVE